eukprot:4449168-Amphidinium_carterae.1
MEVLLLNDAASQVLFPDGTPADSSKYLGRHFSHMTKAMDAVNRAVRSGFTDLHRLKLLWRECRCSDCWKLTVLDAAIRAKIMLSSIVICTPCRMATISSSKGEKSDEERVPEGQKTVSRSLEQIDLKTYDEDCSTSLDGTRNGRMDELNAQTLRLRA